jgi:PKD repeat protein
MRKARWKFVGPSLLALVALIASLIQLEGSGAHPATGVGSCTLKGWNPNTDPNDAKDLPEGQRPQTYKRDDYNCTGAKFAANGVELTRFQQPSNFHINNKQTVRPVPVCKDGACNQLMEAVLQPAATSNPLAPYFPPFTHFVVLYRENHTFDDYLGDCATTVQASCKGVVQGTNHISSVPNLHTLAQSSALLDTYSTGTQPPSGPNHWWLFSAQSSSHSQQQSYPTAGGTQFDRFLKSPSGGYTFIMNGDFYWMLNNGSGYWRNPATNAVEALPVNRPGTSIPEELNYNHYTCCGQNDDDQTIANDYMNFVTANGLPAYSYIELFNDHPGTFQDIPKNDRVTKQVVDSIMNNAAYKDNTLIVVTEDDTQNGNNGPDHISNTYRVPTVVIASPTYMKQHYVSHVAYTTDNVLAAMERTMQNVHPGVIDPNNNIGLATFPMTTADQSGLGDPLEDLWVQGVTPLSATASGTPTTGNAPLSVSFTGSATGGTAPYSYSWNFGDGSAASTLQNPSHTYNSACTCTAVLTVTDSSAPAKTATSNVTINVSAVGSPLAATASGNPTSGQVPLNVAFTGIATGGTPSYSYSWKFGDGSATSALQNPSHTYNSAGTYTAVLTVTDSSAPAKTATSNVTITASPIAGTPPDAPTGLTASAGNGQISLSWAGSRQQRGSLHHVLPGVPRFVIGHGEPPEVGRLQRPRRRTLVHRHRPHQWAGVLLQGQRRERPWRGQAEQRGERDARRGRQPVVAKLRRRHRDPGGLDGDGPVAGRLQLPGRGIFAELAAVQFLLGVQLQPAPLQRVRDQPRLRHLNGDGPGPDLQHEVPGRVVQRPHRPDEGPGQDRHRRLDDVVDQGQHEPGPDDLHPGQPRPVRLQVHRQPGPVQLRQHGYLRAQLPRMGRGRRGRAGRSGDGLRRAHRLGRHGR